MMDYTNRFLITKQSFLSCNRFKMVPMCCSFNVLDSVLNLDIVPIFKNETDL